MKHYLWCGSLVGFVLFCFHFVPSQTVPTGLAPERTTLCVFCWLAFSVGKMYFSRLEDNDSPVGTCTSRELQRQIEKWTALCAIVNDPLTDEQINKAERAYQIKVLESISLFSFFFNLMDCNTKICCSLKQRKALSNCQSSWGNSTAIAMVAASMNGTVVSCSCH